jgi:hypothetical protein
MGCKGSRAIGVGGLSFAICFWATVRHKGVTLIWSGSPCAFRRGCSSAAAVLFWATGRGRKEEGGWSGRPCGPPSPRKEEAPPLRSEAKVTWRVTFSVTRYGGRVGTKARGTWRKVAVSVAPPLPPPQIGGLWPGQSSLSLFFFFFFFFFFLTHQTHQTHQEQQERSLPLGFRTWWV